VLLDGAEVVPQVQLAGGLDAAEDGVFFGVPLAWIGPWSIVSGLCYLYRVPAAVSKLPVAHDGPAMTNEQTDRRPWFKR